MKLALLLPGYLDSPDYLHMKVFDRRLTKMGYTVERLNLCGLWQTGNTKNYTVTNSIRDVTQRIEYYKNQNLEEVILVGHSRGAFTSIIAGSRINEIAKIIALCPPPDILASVGKWVNKGSRVSKRDLPDNPNEFREFSVPYSFVKDSLKYSASEEVKKIYKPLMIFIAMDDKVVPPEKTEEIIKNANNPYVVRMEEIDHGFRRSEDACNKVMDEIEKFIKNN